MNIIEYWAKLTLNESLDESRFGHHYDDDIKFGRVGFGISVPSDLGKNINGIIMPLLFDAKDSEFEDVYMSDIKVNTTYPVKLREYIGGRPLPDEVNERGMVLFIMFDKGKTTIDHVIEFLNGSCKDVLPFELNDDNVISCGTFKRVLSYKRVDGELPRKECELYVVNIQSNDVDKMDIDKDEAIKKFDEIRDSLSDGDVTMSIGKKETFKQFFRKDMTGYNKMKDNTEYIMFFAYENYLDENKVKEIVKNISGKNMNVMKVGQIRRKYSKTQKFENFDLFAAN